MLRTNKRLHCEGSGSCHAVHTMCRKPLLKDLKRKIDQVRPPDRQPVSRSGRTSRGRR